jgi:hypothetical protein
MIEVFSRLIRMDAFMPISYHAEDSFHATWHWLFTQSWLPKQEKDFRPGSVLVSLNDEKLHLHAVLIDEEVMTQASANQQRLWELGDVLELFVQRLGENGYTEYQIAPNGLTLALYYPDPACVAEVRAGVRPLEEFLTDTPPQTQVSTTPLGWNVSLMIPLQKSPSHRLRIHCGRYDYGSDRPPIISSTSPLTVCDFHRPEDWREVIFSEE